MQHKQSCTGMQFVILPKSFAKHHETWQQFFDNWTRDHCERLKDLLEIDWLSTQVKDLEKGVKHFAELLRDLQHHAEVPLQWHSEAELPLYVQGGIREFPVQLAFTKMFVDLSASTSIRGSTYLRSSRLFLCGCSGRDISGCMLSQVSGCELRKMHMFCFFADITSLYMLTHAGFGTQEFRNLIRNSYLCFLRALVSANCPTPRFNESAQV